MRTTLGPLPAVLLAIIPVTIILLLVSATPFMVPSSHAQVPRVEVFFDKGLTMTDASCKGVDSLQTLYVAAINFNMYMSAIEYSIDYSGLTSLVYIADVQIAPLNIGSTPLGVASSWNIPQNAFAPFIVMEVLCSWTCDDCTGQPSAQEIVVRANPSAPSGQIQAVRWPDNVFVASAGATSFVCLAPDPVQETTWGHIKALYH
jgi:hypothetical protein